MLTIWLESTAEWKLAEPRGLSMPELQYNVFIHDVDKLISL